jgi:heme/copper-type cytochrome/quinol oxidase subunit 1
MEINSFITNYKINFKWNVFKKNSESRITYLNNLRKYILKKYIYTVNHKRIALNYFYFTLVSGLSGTALATMIRLELAYPGSHFFKGDSLRYLQVITAHGLVMVFFVAVPLIFGFLGNFLIPYHIGSKDVAFPRLNSIGFWILPVGYLLVAKPAFMRQTYYKYYDKPSLFFPLLNKDKYDKLYEYKLNSSTNTKNKINFDLDYYLSISNNNLPINNFYNYNSIQKKYTNVTENTTNIFNVPLKLLNSLDVFNFSEKLWYVAERVSKLRRKKLYVSKCSSKADSMAGWTFITPFSSNTNYTGVGSQDVAIVAVIAAGISTTISFTNLLITRRTLSMPGLRNRKILLPFVTISLFLVMRMLTLITPVLGAAMIMLLSDRHLKTSFFDYSYGGDAVLFNHLFWFFGHPEVYVIIIPAFGIINMLLPFYNTRRIASKHHLMWAIYIMAYMGFLVWGHHMYLVGLDHRSRSLYSTITVMISLPAIVKIVNWTLTLLNGALKLELPLLFSFAFILFFLCGGLTGMWLSHVALNLYTHDTFYVVAHFHFMFSASTFSALFASVYYYFPALFGIKYSKIFGYFHLVYWFLGQWLTFLPLFWVGYNGLPRRYHDYPVMYMGWHSMSSSGHLITLLSILFFFLMLLDSHIEKKPATINHLGIPRWHKRVLYYTYKIRYLQYTNKKLINLPNKNIRQLITNSYFNEYEFYNIK